MVLKKNNKNIQPKKIDLVGLPGVVFEMPEPDWIWDPTVSAIVVRFTDTTIINGLCPVSPTHETFLRSSRDESVGKVQNLH